MKGICHDGSSRKVRKTEGVKVRVGGQVAQEGIEVTEGLKMAGVHGIHESQLTEQEMVDRVGCLIQSCAQCSLSAQSSNVFPQTTLAQV